MKKDTFYFTHDFFARKDPKCIALLKDFGMVGYGVYWSLIEIMYEQGGKIKKFPSLFSALAHELNIKESVLTKQIEAMLHSFELLVQDENYIWSDAVLRRLEIREQKKLPRVLAGKAGGIKSGESRRKKIEMNQNEALLRSNEANEPKERKGKEKKEKEIIIERGRPDKEIITNYFLQIGLDEFTAQAQAALFFNHYESNGWKVGPNPMKDWRAAARGWKDRIKNYTNGKTVNGNSKNAGQYEIIEELKQEFASRGTADTGS
jgi:hypothetical protein